MTSVTLIQGDSVDSAKVDYRDALAVNMYGINKQILGASGYMYQLPGLTQLGASDGTSRNAIWVSFPDFEGQYRVQGTEFIKLAADGTYEVLGTMPGITQVSMTFTFLNICLVANSNLYYYNPTDGFRQIVDNATLGSVVGDPISVTYVSSIVMLTDGLRLYHSSFSPEVSGLPGEEVFIVSAETIPEFRPDQIYAIHQAENDECIVFKSRSIEHFYLSGGDGFAFTPLNQKASRLGVVGTHSMGLMKGSWYLIGRNEESGPNCYIYRQGQTQKVGSREIEKLLNEYTAEQLETVTVDAIEHDDVELIMFHLPDKTICYNPSIAQTAGVAAAWCIFKSDTNGDIQYRAKDFVLDPRIEDWVVGDRQNGNIGIFNDSVATHYGEIAEWILYTPFLYREALSIDQIEIVTIPGLADPSNDATVFVSRTDNGRSYSKEYSMQYGEQWDYSQRFKAFRMGYVRFWMSFKFRGASRSRMAFGLFNEESS